MISEAAVWSVFGQRGLIDYRKRRVEATIAIPALRNTRYSGCFHDTEKVLAVVEQTHKEVVERRGEYISVLLTVTGMMAQDPSKRPDAWRVYDDLSRALDLAILPAPGPILQLPIDVPDRRPLAQGNYTPRSTAVTLPPNQKARLDLDINALSLQSDSDIYGYQPYYSPSRRSTVNGNLSFVQPSGASSTGKGKSPRHNPYSPAPGTTHGPQWTPLAPISSPVPQPGTPIVRAARPSASVTRVLDYITMKKMNRNPILRGEEWLNKLHGRDQVC